MASHASREVRHASQLENCLRLTREAAVLVFFASDDISNKVYEKPTDSADLLTCFHRNHAVQEKMQGQWRALGLRSQVKVMGEGRGRERKEDVM